MPRQRRRRHDDPARAAVGEARHRRVEERVLQRRPDDVAVVPDEQRRRRTRDRVREQRPGIRLVQDDQVRGDLSQPEANAGAMWTEPTAPIVPTRVTCTPSRTSSNRGARGVRHEHVILDEPAARLAERLDDALDAARMRRIELADVEHAHH